METRLRTGDRTLSDVAKADLARKIDSTNTELTRKNEDAQKIVQERQGALFGPVAQRAQAVLNAYAREMGFAVVLDTSNQASSVVYFADVADITTELIRRIDAEEAKAAPARTPAPAAPAATPAAPAAPRP
jgi:Skp family chaperone for outer membrane proteins